MIRCFARLLALVLALMLAGPAQTEVALVRGGEHPDFTRIVVEAGQTGDWRLGRTEDGYALQLGDAVTGFDLTQAFARIPRDKVSALWRDPDSGQLRFSLSCPCYAVGFEFRPGIVVIDIKPGQPPASSAFEEPLSPPEPPPPIPAPAIAAGTDPMVDPTVPSAPAPATGPTPAYDWLAISRDAAKRADPLPLPFAIADPRLDPLRAALLAQISRGAAAGVVEMAEHPALPDPAMTSTGDGIGMRIADGELPGLSSKSPRDPAPNLSSEGAPCLTDADLEVGSWMLPGPVAEQLGPGRAGLLSEFDAPNADAIHRAARLYIALGFGAEARQFLEILGPGEEGEDVTLRAMSHVADQEPGGEEVFGPMAGCDTAAALWSALTLTAAGGTAPSQVKALNAAAVARSFSALPIHLRRSFGPALVDVFLSAGQDETARQIRDAILRAPGAAGAEVALMDARFDLATGDGKAATTIAQDVAKDAGPQSPEALVTLVEAALKSGSALPENLPATLRAFLGDAQGTALEAPLHRAILLASALQADFAAAFAELPASPDSAADLWALAASGADDNLFLAQAISAAAKGVPAVSRDTGFAVAQRLQGLGFPEQALAWLGVVGPEEDGKTRLLAAQAAMALGDARAAGALVTGLDDPEAQKIRAAAVLQLGDAAAAAEALDKAGDTAGRDRALTWTQDWPKLAQAGADPWKSAAALTDAATAAAAGPPGDATLPSGQAPGQADATTPLARGAALVADSTAARTAVEALLASVSRPSTP
ncbi:hypothetical protein [Neotabrizicola sp. sgz301269]|uniref:hypothetical protein n=1 Tax=Neotabrizicola sp. sgz301269 TaxID=3276282 RepID=UPI0037705034